MWQVGPDEKLCYTFYQLASKQLLNDNKNLPTLHSTLDSLDKTVNATPIDMNHFFAFITNITHLPALPLHRKTFIQLLACRLKWLKQNIHYRLLLSQNREYDEVFQAQLPFLTLFQNFIGESSDLSNPRLGETLFSDPPVLSCRSSGIIQDDQALPFFTFINYFDFSHRPKIISKDYYRPQVDLTLPQAINSPSFLRQKLAEGLGLRDSSKMLHIITQLGYVLTPEFALRLLILHEKCYSNYSLVFSGDTGIGKTELLELFSALVNSNTDQIPDILEELRTLINKKYITDNQRLDRNEEQMARRIRDTVMRVANQLANVQQPLSPSTNQPLLSNAVQQQPHQPVPIQLNPITIDIVQFIRTALNNYPLLKRTPLLEKVADPSTQIREIVGKTEDLATLIDEITHARFQKLYYRILMHQKYSSKELRRTINNIVSDSGALKSPNMKIVVFIDEFNTAKDAMGLIKEEYCDQSMDGDRSLIPQNIFWVAAMNPRE